MKAEIHEDGYHYVPYQFELDDSRVYELLMGRAIYNNPLVAVRELVQNAVDACSYRDALSKLTEPHAQPDTENRITIRYTEPTGDREHPLLEVIDTGTGMDAWVIERWFLKVGRSYYSSSEFTRDRVQLRKSGVDFAPVSEFGIGFLSCFLLADRVDVETAMWEPIRGDTRRRHLEIDGPSRLIRIREDANAGLCRLRGTRVSLTLVRGGKDSSAGVETPPTWAEIKAYLVEVCQDLPYRLNLEHCAKDGLIPESIVRSSMVVIVPVPYRGRELRIPVLDEAAGLEGEIAIVPETEVRAANREQFRDTAIVVSEPGRESYSRRNNESLLLRGGFAIGEVPGLPDPWVNAFVGARIRRLWRRNESRRYSPTNLARTAVVDRDSVWAKISEIWIRYLLDHLEDLKDGFTYGMYTVGNPRPTSSTGIADFTWLQDYSALSVYKLARNGWHYWLLDRKTGVDPVADWESGKGSAMVPAPDSNFTGQLLEVVLPRVAAQRTMTLQGDFYLAPPCPEWREVLDSCHDFISRPVHWSRFVSFGSGIANRLHHDWAGDAQWNRQYKDRLGAFCEDELDVAERLFRALLDARQEGRPSELTRAQADLLPRLIEAVGELEISSMMGVARLDSFR